MSVHAWQALRAASSNAYPIACRFAAGRRLPCLKRTIHTSPSRRREEGPAKDKPEIWNITPEHSSQPEGFPTEQHHGIPEDGPERPPRPKDTSYYGSASRRAGRNVKRVKEIPQVFIPPWFSERNVRLKDEPQRQEKEEEAATTTSDAHSAAEGAVSYDQTVSSPEGAPNPDGEVIVADQQPDSTSRQRSKINKHVREEVSSLISAGLRVPEIQYADSVASIKPHVVLSSPKKGGTSYIEAFVSDVARQRETDFLRLSSQDIAEIGGDYLEDPTSFRSNTLSSLGYDVAQIARASRARPPPEESSEQDEYEESEEPNERQRAPNLPFQTQQGDFGSANVNMVPAFVGTFKLEDLFKTLKNPKGAGGATMDGSEQSLKGANGKPVLQVRDNTPEIKMSMLVESLLNVPELKRISCRSTEAASAGANGSVAASDEDQSQSDHTQRGSHGLIVLVEDYPLINMTMNGGKFLDKLHEVVESRRREGQPVLIVGTASHTDVSLAPGDHKAAVDSAQTHPWSGPMRTVVVPVKGLSTEVTLNTERRRKIANINLRHLRDMLRRIAPIQEQVGPVIYDWDLSIETKWAFIAGLDQSVWSLDKVNRVATIALGLVPTSEAMSAKTIENALEIIDAADSSKYTWYKKHFEKEAKVVDDLKSSFSGRDEDNDERMKKLRKKCNSYEKKLLNGVVDPKQIRTSFADVQAPPETVQALKTLTSLSLVRPDAFTYGVLATDRIPGLLLYGPPGTGKTLLAKAVAKESNATVLEVSGSDVYDMYVGEGEKNVRAIFSLAKKLSPCIVFIDEADAILGSRDGGRSRTSHRELINQFLREWDGMTETSAFIMVATNRPFDLDEASLRRLPRRLLVDLPTEKDREAILGIHLKDEILDPSVSIPVLASKTPYYSGSDLKNVSVAAALACVREEFDTAMAHNETETDAEEKYQYAEKRTLHQRHFDTAMEEISASISEDMGSLSAIRKFDEKYGDRRGRRKKLGGYGFKTVDDSEKLRSDAARVRKPS